MRDTGSPKPLGQIAMSLAELDQRLGVLGEALNELESLLSPILLKVPAEPGPTKTSQPIVDLAAVLDTYTDRVDCAVRQVRVMSETQQL